MIEFCVTIEYYGNNRQQGRHPVLRQQGNNKMTMDKGVKLCRI